MTPPSTSAVVGTMWRRILERLFPRLRPALKAPEELAPDHPQFVFVAITGEGLIPYTESSSGELFVLASTSAEEFSAQAAYLYRSGFRDIRTQFIHFPEFYERVADNMPDRQGIAIAGHGGSMNLVYTR